MALAYRWVTLTPKRDEAEEIQDHSHDFAIRLTNSPTALSNVCIGEFYTVYTPNTLEFLHKCIFH